MPDENVSNTDLNLAALGEESVTHTSADQSAEKTKSAVRHADHAAGSATEDTVDVEGGK